MARSYRMLLRPSLLWLTLNLALIIQCYQEMIYIFFKFTYTVKRIRISWVVDHCSRLGAPPSPPGRPTHALVPLGLCFLPVSQTVLWWMDVLLFCVLLQQSAYGLFDLLEIIIIIIIANLLFLFCLFLCFSLPYVLLIRITDRHCGLVVRIPGCRSKGPVFDSRHYQISREVVSLGRGPLSLVSTIEELLGRKSSGSGLESQEYSRSDPSCRPSGIHYRQKLTLTSPTSGGRSVGIVRSRTQATEFGLLYISYIIPIMQAVRFSESLVYIYYCVRFYATIGGTP
jgi:hypothetical protein